MRLIILAFFFIIASSSNAQPVRVHGQLHVEGTQLKDSHNKDVVLRGMSFGWHNFWPSVLQCRRCEMAGQRLELFSGEGGDGCRAKRRLSR